VALLRVDGGAPLHRCTIRCASVDSDAMYCIVL